MMTVNKGKLTHHRQSLAESELDFMCCVLEHNGHAEIVYSQLLKKTFQTQNKFIQGAKNPDFPLHLAARSGDLNEVKKLINAGYKVNKTDIFGSTPLHMAAMYGHKEVAEYLILKGATLNAPTYEYDKAGYYYTPLDLAAKYAPNTATVEFLMQKNAKPSDWNGIVYSLMSNAFDAYDDNNYAVYDLSLSKLEIIAKGNIYALWIYDGEDVPLSLIFKNYSTRVTDSQYYNRTMDCVNSLDLADKTGLAKNFIAAKNFLHAFPSDHDYTFKINNYPGEISAQGYHSVFTTVLASRSLSAYQLSITGQNDFASYKLIKAKFSQQTISILDNVEVFSQLKQNIISTVAEIYQQGAQAKQQAALYANSEEIFKLYQAGKTIILPCGWQGHAIDIILDKTENLFIVANGGDSYPGIKSGLNAYTPHFSITSDEIYRILTNEEKMELEFKHFYDLGLDYNPEFSLFLPEQTFGNCSWYSQQLSERALIFLELTKLTQHHDLSVTLSDNWFKQLDDFHQTMVLKEYLINPYLNVAALGDVLLSYHNKLETAGEKERAKLILDTLTSSAIKNDFTQYYIAHRSEFTPELKQFIKDVGFKIDGFKQFEHATFETEGIISFEEVIQINSQEFLSGLDISPIMSNTTPTVLMAGLPSTLLQAFHEEHLVPVL